MGWWQKADSSKRVGFPIKSVGIKYNLGDEILSVNGICLSGMTHAESLEIFKQLRSSEVVLCLRCSGPSNLSVGYFMEIVLPVNLSDLSEKIPPQAFPRGSTDFSNFANSDSTTKHSMAPLPHPRRIKDQFGCQFFLYLNPISNFYNNKYLPASGQPSRSSRRNRFDDRLESNEEAKASGTHQSPPTVVNDQVFTCTQ
jgi:hypothetical protein